MRTLIRLAAAGGLILTALLVPAPEARADVASAVSSAVAQSDRGLPAVVRSAVADTYRLRGAATAIDAAALGCARLR